MNRIRERRLELARQFPSAFSVVALAHRLGVSESILRRWESGNRNPTRRHARKLAKELGVTVDDLGLGVLADGEDDASEPATHDEPTVGRAP